MIRRLLIANRGEIACRIARTARARGIATVAVVSPADAAAPHARACDTAVALPGGYLDIPGLIGAAARAGADAIHPGYGFLAENAAFAEAVSAAGLTWIGPPPAAIRAMGAKDRAKRLMEAAGVPVVPGYHGEAQDIATLADAAAAIGYPVLVKARAGGGGKGMRRVDAGAALPEAIARARSEAEASFGDGHLLVEKLVANPRHVEVQVLADAHGTCLHLFERDCSAQRRHQKVIEEAPAPGLSPAFRAAIAGAAVRAAEAVDYTGAGTVEFIADGAAIAEGRADGFFFMEMNTRLQVEHPVTEAVTGLDLVAWQIAVAEGARLPAQESIARDGHAIEARLYAEDPARGFLPQTGRLDGLRLAGCRVGDTDPRPGPGLRVDTGVIEGQAVTADYDPMLAKIIAHGPSREAALARLSAALADSAVEGRDHQPRVPVAPGRAPGLPRGAPRHRPDRPRRRGADRRPGAGARRPGAGRRRHRGPRARARPLHRLARLGPRHLAPAPDGRRERP